MINHLKYLKFLLKHKWWVFLVSCRLGIAGRGILHDLSKFLPDEWIPRVNALKNYQGNLNKTEWNADQVEEDMKLCWLRHYHRNPHHWQWWVTMLDSGSLKVFPMTDCYRREMLADWIAVSKRADRLDIIPWYRQNKDNMVLHSETRAWLEEQLDTMQVLK